MEYVLRSGALLFSCRPCRIASGASCCTVLPGSIASDELRRLFVVDVVMDRRYALEAITNRAGRGILVREAER